MLRRCRCIVNVTLFSRATLVRKLQSTSDLDRFHTRDLPCLPVNSCDDPISNCRVGSAVPYSFIYRLQNENCNDTVQLFLTVTPWFEGVNSNTDRREFSYRGQLQYAVN